MFHIVSPSDLFQHGSADKRSITQIFGKENKEGNVVRRYRTLTKGEEAGER